MPIVKSMAEMLKEEWLKVYRNCNAIWIHDGNSKRPHALLTSGMHSDGFCNTNRVAENPSTYEKAVCDLLKVFALHGEHVQNVDRVVGPAMGAITLAYIMALNINYSRPQPSCLCGYTEKENGAVSKRMVFTKIPIETGERVLVVEDVTTTGESAHLTAIAVENAGGIALPFVLTLVNRSGLEEIHGRKIIALINHPMQTWTKEKCPLCKMGSEALPPKSAENWKHLNAQY